MSMSGSINNEFAVFLETVAKQHLLLGRAMHLQSPEKKNIEMVHNDNIKGLLMYSYAQKLCSTPHVRPGPYENNH